MNNEVKNVPGLRFPGFVDEWKTVQLGDIAKFSKGSGISKADIRPDGDRDAIRYGELYTTYGEVVTSVRSRVISKPSDILSETNDVLIPSSGETAIDISTATYVGKNGVAIGGDLNIIKTDENGKFLSYYFNHKKRIDIAKLAQGVSVVHLYGSDLKTLKVNLPNKQEQEKIAEFLTAVDGRINLASCKVEKLETYKRGLAQKIFTRTLRFKRDDGSDFPDWGEKHIGDIGKVVTGKTPTTSKKELWNGGLAFITPTDIVEGKKYQFLTERTVSEGYVNDILPIGTTVFTCIASIGKMAITSIPSVTNQQINSIIPSELVDQEFLFYAVQSIAPKIKASQASNTLPIINKTEFSKFRVPVPDKAEQQKIATFLSQIDEKITLETRKLEELKKFKKALLQRMFA